MAFPAAENENRQLDLFVFVVIQRMFSSWVRWLTLRFLFEGCRSFYFHLLSKSTFPVSKGLLYLYDKQNNAWLLVDMKFLFSCWTRHLTRSLRSLVSYRLNPLTPKTDQHLISPYNITPESNMKVMRIKEMITN